MVPHVCCQFLLCLLGDSGFLVGCGGLSLDNISTMMLWREMYGILLRICMICDIGRRVPHDIFHPPPPAPACNVSLNGLLKMLAIFSFIFSSLHPPPPAPSGTRPHVREAGSSSKWQPNYQVCSAADD